METFQVDLKGLLDILGNHLYSSQRRAAEHIRAALRADPADTCGSRSELEWWLEDLEDE
ncbi:hypothetical protein [Gordonia sp. CPCC 205333]|uniref:hypothetical protein n=1 Tax=Gordonia sp. CPCC 205333 TaxID=3140790 RepID=UPI003AF3C8FA